MKASDTMAHRNKIETTHHEAGEAAFSIAVPWSLRIVFALLIFSIPFESVPTALTTGSFSISKIAGWLFFLVAAIYPKNSFRSSSVIIWLFSLYLMIYFFFGLYQDPDFLPEITERTLTILQMIVFLWVAQNLLADPVTARFVLFALGASTAILSLLQTAGITGTPTVQANERMAVLAEDPNSAAAVLGLGFLSLTGLAYFSAYKSKWFKLAVLPILAVILMTIVKTGSRTGLIGLLLGILIFSINKQGEHSTLKNIAVVCLSVLMIAIATLSNLETTRRFERAFLHGNMAKREQIIPTSIEMIEEKPLMGWGPFTNTRELGIRSGHPTRDTHNLFLLVLTEVGIIGSLPYFIALIGCARRAWMARSKLDNIIPLALLACLFIVNNGVTWHTRKLHWFVLAYCIASFSTRLTVKKYLNPYFTRSYALD